jgi:hypothetical protein
VQEHPLVSLAKAQGVTHLVRRPSLHVPEAQDEPLVRGQDLNGSAKAVPGLLSHEPSLWRRLVVLGRPSPVTGLSQAIREEEAVRGDRRFHVVRVG